MFELSEICRHHIRGQKLDWGRRPPSHSKICEIWQVSCSLPENSVGEKVLYVQPLVIIASDISAIMCRQKRLFSHTCTEDTCEAQKPAGQIV